jgi:hypothetical protein
VQGIGPLGLAKARWFMSPTPVYKVLDYGSMKVKLESYNFTVEEWKKAEKNETRAKVIVEDALFDDILGYLIGYALSPKDDVLSTLLKSMELNDRARLAYVLRVIPKGTMQDLHRIHNIRNKWAHLEKPSLDDKELKKNVLALSTVGSKKKKEVTEANYMDFFWDAVQDCRKTILDAVKRVDPELMQLIDNLHDMQKKGEDMDAFFKAVEEGKKAKKARSS